MPVEDSDCQIPDFDFSFTLPIPKLPDSVPLPDFDFTLDFQIPVCPLD